MTMPCEAVIKKFLPAIRASVTSELYERHNFSQVQIAESLGVTQAAVSNYLAGKYAKHIKKLESTPMIQKAAKDIAMAIISGKTKGKPTINAICVSCSNYSGFKCRAKAR